MTDRLVLSVSEAADALGVSDDLMYELTERGEIPCLRFGRRKLIPRRAIEMLVESVVADFDPAVTSLAERPSPVPTGTVGLIAPAIHCPSAATRVPNGSSESAPTAAP